MIKHVPRLTGFLMVILSLISCKPINDVEFETLQAARVNLTEIRLPDWLPHDAVHIKLQSQGHQDNLFIRFKTKQAEAWLPSTCYRSNFIDQLPSELPIWWPSNATQYSQIDALYKLYLCKDQSLWWVAIPHHPEFVLMWK